VCKHEIGEEQKVVELYANKKDKQISHYVKKHKEHEARRASANERANYWKTYKEYLK
jgi:hypothetical protein